MPTLTAYWIEAPAARLLHRPDCVPAYIGQSADPERRLRQHNRELAGGARYTGLYRGWEFKRRVTGFTDARDCLRFEHQLDRVIRRAFTAHAREAKFRELMAGPHGYGLTVE
jgi:predicted GIY-YIG superfamily endonuclease